MTRTTRYMKRVAARGNARVVQPSIPQAPVLGAVRDHAHKTNGSSAFRAAPAVVCGPCLLQPIAHWPIYVVCRDAECADTARGCEVCGDATDVSAPIEHRVDMQRRWGR